MRPNGPELFAVHIAGPRLLASFEAGATVHTVLDGVPLGVYTALCTVGHDRFIGLSSHIARLAQSTTLAGLEPPAEWGALVGAIQALADDSPYADSILRIDVLSAPFPPDSEGGRLVITRAPWRAVPSELKDAGVGVGIERRLVRERPLIKDAHFAVARRPYPLLTADHFDHLLLDADERVLEGTSSNVFIVQGGTLVTAADGVLEGITRATVLELAGQQGLDVEFRRPTLSELVSADEVFLTSSTRGLIGVNAIEGRARSGAAPGPITRRLTDGYSAAAAWRALRAVP